MLENTWNTSFRIMFGLPYSTHRYFVEPVSGKTHLKKLLLKRFLAFLNQIEESQKSLPKKLLKSVKKDTRSTTGLNLRKMMLLLGKVRVEDIGIKDIDNFEYVTVPPEDQWKIAMVKEIIEVKNNNLVVENFEDEELQEIIDHLCSS